MRIGTRVVVVADWSSFIGMHGVVTQLKPYLMVRLDDDPRPMRMGDKEVTEDVALADNTVAA